MYAAGYQEEQLINARLLRKSDYTDGYYEFFSGGKRFSGRIMSADIDHAHRAAYLLARILPWEDDGEAAKYLGPPEFAKPVLGIATLPRNDSPVALVEGFWNMITLRKWGVPSIAVSGANLSPDQTVTLLRLPRKIIPIRDMDEPNAKGIIPGLEALRAWQKAIPDIPDGITLPKKVDDIQIKDVNDLDKHPDGQRIFADLSAKWGLPAG
jgi:DNA primase